MTEDQIPTFKSGDSVKSLFNAKRLNLPIDALNELIREFNALNQTPPPEELAHFAVICRIVAHGPNNEKDFTDARYWVEQKMFCRHKNPTQFGRRADQAELETIDLPWDRKIAIATNLAEIREKSHNLDVGTEILCYQDNTQNGILKNKDDPWYYFFNDCRDFDARIDDYEAIPEANRLYCFKYAWTEMIRTANGWKPKPGGRKGKLDCCGVGTKCDPEECGSNPSSSDGGSSGSGCPQEKLDKLCRWALNRAEGMTQGGFPVGPVEKGAIVRMHLEFRPDKHFDTNRDGDGFYPEYTFDRAITPRLGIVICHGPCGEKDYTDNRYWVQVLDIEAGAPNEIVTTPVKPAPIQCKNEECPPAKNRIVTVINLAENNKNTHRAKPGSYVYIMGQVDTGNTLHYITPYIDLHQTGYHCDGSSASSGSGGGDCDYICSIRCETTVDGLRLIFTHESGNETSIGICGNVVCCDRPHRPHRPHRHHALDVTTWSGRTSGLPVIGEQPVARVPTGSTGTGPTLMGAAC